MRFNARDVTEQDLWRYHMDVRDAVAAAEYSAVGAEGQVDIGIMGYGTPAEDVEEREH